MGVEMVVRPLSSWPGQPLGRRRPSAARRSLFSAGWSQTDALLRREAGHLGATRLVLEMDISEGEIRNDGWIRASARPASPAVIVSFDSRHGPLRYPCDTYYRWQDNVRAIALAMQALRAVDRYGVTRHGEQYRGFAALPAPDGGAMTVCGAAVLINTCANAFSPGQITESPEALRQAWRVAAKTAHPDQGGDPELFKRLQAARDVIERYQAGGG